MRLFDLRLNFQLWFVYRVNNRRTWRDSNPRHPVPKTGTTQFHRCSFVAAYVRLWLAYANNSGEWHPQLHANKRE